MKIKFLKNCTVDVMNPSNGDNDTYDKSMRSGVEIDCLEIQPISRGFSNIHLENGDVFIDVRNDYFVKES